VLKYTAAGVLATAVLWPNHQLEVTCHCVFRLNRTWPRLLHAMCYVSWCNLMLML